MAFISFQEAKNLISDELSHFEIVNSIQHVALNPKHIGNFKAGIVKHLSAEMQLYSEKLCGVQIAYSNVKVPAEGLIVEEQPYIHLNIEADFIIFKPEIGDSLRGVVNKLSNSHIGCLVHKCFNASIKRLDADYLSLGDQFIFKVLELEIHNRVISIRGKLVAESIHQPDPVHKSRKRTRVDVESESELDASCADSKHHKKHKKHKKHKRIKTDPDSEFLEANNGDSKHKKKKKHREKHNDSQSNNELSSNLGQVRDHRDSSDSGIGGLVISPDKGSRTTVKSDKQLVEFDSL